MCGGINDLYQHVRLQVVLLVEWASKYALFALRYKIITSITYVPNTSVQEQHLPLSAGGSSGNRGGGRSLVATILYHTLDALWLVPCIVCSEGSVVVTPTLGNGTLRNRMKMFATDSAPPVQKQYPPETIPLEANACRVVIVVWGNALCEILTPSLVVRPGGWLAYRTSSSLFMSSHQGVSSAPTKILFCCETEET